MKVETKYNLRELVWFMDNNKPREDKVWNINVVISDRVDIYCVFFNVGGSNKIYKEEIEIFKSKEELLKSLQ